MKDDERIICRCEEITQGEIKEAIKFGLKTMTEVKRFTRAGMGLCQGTTCGRLVMDILACETNQPLSEVEPCTSRPPVRPVPVSVLANRIADDEES